MNARPDPRFRILLLIAAATLFVGLGISSADDDHGQANFDLDAVTQLKWTAGDQSVTLKKQKSAKDPNGLWVKSAGARLQKDFKADSWAVHRRLVLLVQTGGPADSAVTLSGEPAGELEISVGKEKIEGAFDSQNFVWKAGPNSGHGFALASHAELKNLIDEGIMGLSAHELSLCDPKKVTEIDNAVAGWILKKEKNKWTLGLKSGDVPARPFEASEWTGRVCKVKVDKFIGDATAPQTAGDQALRVFSGKKEIQVMKIAAPSGYKIGAGAGFTSAELDAALHVNVDYLKDVSVEAGKIALDIHMPQKDRIDAIRKMRDAHSPESVEPLKKLIDEETEIDLYRYEAVDALAAIGTKAAYKAISDRLGEIGRSGFELRLARALAMGMGSSFRSDEKTPEPQRRKEVQDLLERARKDPPGR